MSDKEKKEIEDNKENTLIVGISVIQSLVTKVISDPSQILSGIKQILYFYRLLPDKWKKKAFWIFEKLWGKKKVVISTEPEKSERVYELTFDNEDLTQLYKNLPEIDQAIFLQGREMQLLIQKGLHGDSDEIKLQVEKRYGQRGLNIVNMLTTNDVEYFLEETKKPITKEVESKFNEWVNKYDSFTLLVSPLGLSNPSEIKKKIIALAKNSFRKYILINLSGKMEECTSLMNMISELKEKKELNFSNFDPDIKESGFCKSLRIKIDF